VALTLAPFQESASERFDIAGPNISLSSNKSLLVIMALHELGTNAVKYGALSTEDGRVQLHWELNGADPPRLKLRWRESRGPAVRPPSRRGFGSVVIERALQGEGGGAHIEFDPAGVIVRLKSACRAEPRAARAPS
jgi:two-component sensor histidine kinase